MELSYQMTMSTPILNSENSPTQEGSDPFLAQRQSLFAYLYRLLGDGHRAEDLVQETWLALDKAQQKGDEILNCSAWCRGVARHLAQKHWRTISDQKVTMDSELMDLIELSVEEAPVENDDSDRQKALGRCLEELPESAQQLLQKKYEENLSFAEIAPLLKSSASALMMKASRVRAKLAKCIEQRLHTEMVNP
jgi:RNA polymerase sigma-70 factor (ECF subfamily)